MVPGRRGFEGLDRLDIRLVALLGLALLPIGIIAMVQTYRVIDDANARAESALLGETLEAAAREREIILSVMGAGKIAAALMPRLLKDPGACAEVMKLYEMSSENIAFAGHIGEDGSVTCASDGQGIDVSSSVVFQAYKKSRESLIMTITRARISGRSVIVAVEPVQVDGRPEGYVAFSIPHSALSVDRQNRTHDKAFDTLTFNNKGDVLTSQTGLDTVEQRLPSTRSLATFNGTGPVLFHEVSRAGNDRIYSVAPLLEGAIYAMSIWRPSAGISAGLTAVTAVLFPFLMWLVSLGVAYFAVHRLVTRHIRSLRQRIRAFSATRRVLPISRLDEAPTELREVIESFEAMTDQILRDEAELEDSLHEKDVLLKEVHHRVKNNLQLIASMTNMQLRKTANPETKQVLRRLQDRVLGLATIHRNLYQASVLSHVRADTLIRELVSQMLRGSDAAENGARVDIHVDPVSLYPDQAVPLSLLVTEATTNALKYVGRPKDGEPWLNISLVTQQDGQINLRIGNSLGAPLGNRQQAEISGLGGQLIGAFVMQLEARAINEQTEDSFVVDITFRPSNFATEP